MGEDAWMRKRWVMITVMFHVIDTWIIKQSKDSVGAIRFWGGECGSVVSHLVKNMYMTCSLSTCFPNDHW